MSVTSSNFYQNKSQTALCGFLSKIGVANPLSSQEGTAMKIADLAEVKELCSVGLSTSNRRINACWFTVGSEQEVAVLDEIKPQGSFKLGGSGVMTLGERIVDVYVLRTKDAGQGAPLFRQQMTRCEGKMLLRAVSDPILGMVPVIAVNPREAAQDPVSPGSGGITEFTAVFPEANCDLFDFLEHRERSLSRADQNLLALKILEAAFLFGQSFVHGDIKPENILLFMDEGNWYDSLKVCLTDLGFATNRTEDRTLQSKGGTSNYRPPEYIVDPREIKGTIPVGSNDAWACGMVLLRIFSPRVFQRLVQYGEYLSEKDRVQRTNALYREYFRSQEIECFPEPRDENSVLHIVWELLNPDPAQRLSLEGALGKMQRVLPAQCQLKAS